MSLESRAGPAGEVVLGCSGRDLTQQLRMGMEVKGGGGEGGGVALTLSVGNFFWCSDWSWSIQCQGLRAESKAAQWMHLCINLLTYIQVSQRQGGTAITA